MAKVVNVYNIPSNLLQKIEHLCVYLQHLCVFRIYHKVHLLNSCGHVLATEVCNSCKHPFCRFGRWDFESASTKGRKCDTLEAAPIGFVQAVFYHFAHNLWIVKCLGSTHDMHVYHIQLNELGTRMSV